jgi:chromosomal replication initiation ATPase DnaA
VNEQRLLGCVVDTVCDVAGVSSRELAAGARSADHTIARRAGLILARRHTWARGAALRAALGVLQDSTLVDIGKLCASGVTPLVVRVAERRMIDLGLIDGAGRRDRGSAGGVAAEEVVRTVCDAYAVDPGVLGDVSGRAVARDPRAVAAWVLRSVLGLPRTEVAAALSLARTSNVWQCVQRVEHDERLRLVAVRIVHRLGLETER